MYNFFDTTGIHVNTHISVKLAKFGTMGKFLASYIMVFLFLKATPKFHISENFSLYGSMLHNGLCCCKFIWATMNFAIDFVPPSFLAALYRSALDSDYKDDIAINLLA